jgi:hypothetical protein
MIRRSTWIVLIIFIILVVIVLIWQRVQVNKQATITPTPAANYLLNLEGKKITGIAITGPTGQSVVANKGTDGNWVLMEPSGQPADSSRIDAAIGSVSRLQVVSNLTKVVDLETLGLNPASTTIELILDDGTRMNVFVGNLTPTQTGYNVFMNGQPLKIVERFGLEDVLAILDNPPILQPTPTGEESFLPTEQP